jgi:hypothetical protein
VPFITLYEGGWDHHTNLFQGLDDEAPTVRSGACGLIVDSSSAGCSRRPSCSRSESSVAPPHQQGRRAGPLVERHVGLFRRLRHTGRHVVGSTDKQGVRAEDRILSPERTSSRRSTQARDRPDKIYYTRRGVGPPGQRSDADSGVDVGRGRRVAAARLVSQRKDLPVAMRYVFYEYSLAAMRAAR